MSLVDIEVILVEFERLLDFKRCFLLEFEGFF